MRKQISMRKCGIGLISLALITMTGCTMISNQNEATKNNNQVAEQNANEQNANEQSETQSMERSKIDPEVESRAAAAYADTEYTPLDGYADQHSDREYGNNITDHYYSTTTKSEREVTIMLPAGYDSSKEYPVLYLMHGMGGYHGAWDDLGADTIATNAYYDYGSSQMILVGMDVFTAETGEESSSDIATLVRSYDNVINDLMNDLMPFIEQNYPVRIGRDNTAIAGYSLGAREALYIGFQHPEVFGYIGAFSTPAGVVEETARGVMPGLLNQFTINEVYGQHHLILMNVGDHDGLCKVSAEQYDTIMERDGLNHIFYEIDGDHEPHVWQNGLLNFVRRIF